MDDLRAGEREMTGLQFLALSSFTALCAILMSAVLGLAGMVRAGQGWTGRKS